MSEKFTVLWKKDDGYEEGFPGVAKFWVRRDLPGKHTNDSKEMTVGIRFDDPDAGDNRFFNEGTVYVMNENGRTVATYYVNPVAMASPSMDRSK